MANWWKEKAEWERDDTRIRIRKEFAEEIIEKWEGDGFLRTKTERIAEIRALAEGGE